MRQGIGRGLAGPPGQAERRLRLQSLPMARWTFGDFVLDLDARELARAGTPMEFSPKALQLLGMLVEVPLPRRCRRTSCRTGSGPAPSSSRRTSPIW